MISHYKAARLRPYTLNYPVPLPLLVHNGENSFCVLRVKAPGHREETTVIGSLPSVTAGEWLVADGGWTRDKEHGLQFKATTMKTVPPTTADGIQTENNYGKVRPHMLALSQHLARASMIHAHTAPAN